MRMMNLLAHPDNINELVDYLLFVDEAPFPGPIQGSSGFAGKFSGAGPRDHLGRSLRDFDLQRRLMRYPCSYMIYTESVRCPVGALQRGDLSAHVERPYRQAGPTRLTGVTVGCPAPIGRP